MKKSICACALGLCLLGGGVALAATEGVVREASPVNMQVAQAEVSYVPDSGYDMDRFDPTWSESEVYVESPRDKDTFYDVSQSPRLTPGERARARKLLAAYEAGEASGDGASVLNRMEDVVLGVYPLNPQDYDGETVYVLLPGTCLTDEQLLALIDAYHRLGLTFDPDGLSYRNCARGGGVETGRFLTEEERARREVIRDLIRRGTLTDIPDAEIVSMEMTLDWRYYSGLEHFSLRPYRAMTDEELAAELIAVGVRDESGTVDFDGMEAKARRALADELGCPLSMETEWINVNGASFRYTSEQGVPVYAEVIFDVGTGNITHANAMDVPPMQSDAERSPEITDAVCVETARRYAREKLGQDGLTFEAGKVTTTNWGQCVETSAIRPDGMCLSLYIGAEDGQVHGVAIDSSEEVEAPCNA